MTRVILIFGLLIAFFLQVNFLRSFSIFGTTANLILIFLIYVSIYRSWREALFLAFLSGLLLDLVLGEPFGLNLLFFLTTSFIIIFFKREANFETLFYILIFIVSFSLAYNLTLAAVLYFKRISLNPNFLKSIISQDIQTLIVVLLMYYPFTIFFERIKSLEKNK